MKQSGKRANQGEPQGVQPSLWAEAQPSEPLAEEPGAKRPRKKNRRRAKRGEPQLVTRAITHIRLEEANAGKLATLDALATPYMALTQQYVTFFCTEELPNSYRAQFFPTLLSARWHRVAIQQAAGIARSWRSNRANAYEDYVDAVAEYHDRKESGELSEGEQAPVWRE
jgi:hypothetical protein